MSNTFEYTEVEKYIIQLLRVNIIGVFSLLGLMIYTFRPFSGIYDLTIIGVCFIVILLALLGYITAAYNITPTR